MRRDGRGLRSVRDRPSRSSCVASGSCHLGLISEENERRTEGEGCCRFRLMRAVSTSPGSLPEPAAAHLLLGVPTRDIEFLGEGSR